MLDVNDTSIPVAEKSGLIMMWDKKGMGVARSAIRSVNFIGRQIGYTSDKSEDIVADSIQQIYPNVENIKKLYKEAVAGMIYSSVPESIAFKPNEIHIYPETLNYKPKIIKIPNDKIQSVIDFGTNIINMYKDMNDDVPPITSPAGQENLMKDIENAP
jgi:hypothetical protein